MFMSRKNYTLFRFIFIKKLIKRVATVQRYTELGWVVQWQCGTHRVGVGLHNSETESYVHGIPPSSECQAYPWGAHWPAASSKSIVVVGVCSRRRE